MDRFLGPADHRSPGGTGNAASRAATRPAAAAPVKAERIAERERRAAEKQRRREENERNRLRNLERKVTEERAREAAKRGEKPPLPTVVHKKRRWVDPKDRKE